MIIEFSVSIEDLLELVILKSLPTRGNLEIKTIFFVASKKF